MDICFPDANPLFQTIRSEKTSGDSPQRIHQKETDSHVLAPAIRMLRDEEEEASRPLACLVFISLAFVWQHTIIWFYLDQHHFSSCSVISFTKSKGIFATYCPPKKVRVGQDRLEVDLAREKGRGKRSIQQDVVFVSSLQQEADKWRGSKEVN